MSDNFQPSSTGSPTIVVPDNAAPYDDSVMTQKELLLELRHDVRRMASVLDVIAAQDLHSRTTELERWRQRADGRMDTLVKGVPFLGGVVGLVSAGLAVLATLTLIP